MVFEADFRQNAGKGERWLCLVGVFIDSAFFALSTEEMEAAKNEDAAEITIARLQVLEMALCACDC